METMTQTTFEDKTDILADFWITYKSDKGFQDFIAYNDLGFPLAYAISSDIVSVSEKAGTFIEETWDLLLTALEIEDTGFETLDDLMILIS